MIERLIFLLKTIKTVSQIRYDINKAKNKITGESPLFLHYYYYNKRSTLKILQKHRILLSRNIVNLQRFRLSIFEKAF